MQVNQIETPSNVAPKVSGRIVIFKVERVKQPFPPLENGPVTACLPARQCRNLAAGETEELFFSPDSAKVGHWPYVKFYAPNCLGNGQEQIHIF